MFYNEQYGAYMMKGMFDNIYKKDCDLSFGEINKLNKSINITTLTESDLDMLYKLAKAMNYRKDNLMFMNDKLQDIYNIPKNKISLRNIIKIAVKYRDTGIINYDNLDTLKIPSRNILTYFLGV